MEPVSMNTSHSFWHPVRLAVGISLLWMAGCSLNPSDSSNANLTQPDSFAYDPNAVAAEFDFPQASCGEQASQPNSTWYVVYIDKANPDEVRRQYCRDAIGTTRRGSGVPTVQVASFADYSKAMRFASAVGGEVEATTAPNTSTSASPSPSPTAQAANLPSGSMSTGSLAIGDTAYLVAQESGALINVRESATLSSPVRQTGRAGQQVRVVEQTNGQDGYLWYKVASESGQEGWVRGDLVSQQNGGTGASPAQTTPPQTASAPSSTTGNPGFSSSGTTPDRTAYRSPSSSSSAWAGSGQATDPRSFTDVPDQPDEQESAEDPANPGESATLVAENPNARINIRDEATTSSDIRSVGVSGDPVYISDVSEGDDGYTWYYVEFDSGVAGWVRGDFVDGI